MRAWLPAHGRCSHPHTARSPSSPGPICPRLRQVFNLGSRYIAMGLVPPNDLAEVRRRVCVPRARACVCVCLVCALCVGV